MGKRLAFVLPGGGAAGCEQLGQLKAVMASGIEPDFMVCTSAGALNGAGISYAGVRETEAMWRSIRSESDVFDGELWVELPWRSGLKNAGPIKEKLAALSKDRSPQIAFCVTGTEMKSHQLVVTPSTDPDIANMIIASARIPGYVEAYEKDDKVYCDGGVMMNCPAQAAVNLGAEAIVIFHCRSENPTIGDKWRLSNPAGGFIRGFELCDEALYEVQRKVSVPTIDIWAGSNDIGPLDFEPTKIAMGIDRGFANALTMIDQIRAMLTA